MSTAAETAAMRAAEPASRSRLAQRGDGLRGDGEVVQLVVALLPSVSTIDVWAKWRSAKAASACCAAMMRGTTPRRHPLVRALERRDVAHVDGDDRGGQREDRAEAEAELDGQAHVPESGRAAGNGGDA